MCDVKLIDHMGSDEAIVQAARVSYAKGTRSVSDTRGLIRYLMRHWHNTPFEMVEFKFWVRCPIYVARQWVRHRTASVNEMSARYSILPDEFFLPDKLRVQSTSNKQGGEEPMENDTNLLLKQKASCDLAFHTYDELLNKGCSRELARAHLPLCTYTEFFWKMNLHNLFHFLELRMDSHAQKEIRDYATIIGEQIIEIEKRHRVVLTVHDAVACVVPEDEAQEARAYIEQCMRTSPKWAKDLPLNCESGMARTYGDC